MAPFCAVIGIGHQWRVSGATTALSRRCERCDREQAGKDWRWLVTRATACKAVGHKWVSVTHPGTEDSRFTRCWRCARERAGHGSNIAPFL